MSRSDSGCELAHPGQYQGEPAPDLFHFLKMYFSKYIFISRAILRGTSITFHIHIKGNVKGNIKVYFTFSNVFFKIYFYMQGNIKGNQLQICFTFSECISQRVKISTSRAISRGTSSRFVSLSQNVFLKESKYTSTSRAISRRTSR